MSEIFGTSVIENKRCLPLLDWQNSSAVHASIETKVHISGLLDDWENATIDTRRVVVNFTSKTPYIT